MSKVKKVAIFLSLFLVLSPGFSFFVTEVAAEDNPFLDREQQLRYEDEPKRLLEGVNLSAILYSAKGSRAIIDGEIVEVGDVINNMEVVEIKSEKVLFKDCLGKESVLKMEGILTTSSDGELGEEFPE